MWLEWSTRLITLLALLTVVGGLLVLALPDSREGPQILQLDESHSIRRADLIGAALLTAGVLSIWTAVLAWQRKRLS